ncbi:MAG: RNA polymerase sigma-70 factor [Verrucomicrobia bacterium]|nr:RNA polymerase sigma-70 factor [Verrucomicrobiota bacterium]MBV8484527.1 RNA polymerase sigma-70 factor [Verrucomicrobiota bacterium]
MIDPFLEHRRLLFSIAYRILGSVAEAEDAVQDTFIRWQSVAEKKEEIRSSKAWLVATVTRLSIDRLRSAQRQREQYVGVWLPEPLMATTIDFQNQTGALADSINTAFMVMLETLTPEERAVFILREAFDYNYNEISTIVGKSEANCRQIARRAKEHLSQPGRRRPVDPAQAETLVQQFLSACRDGDVATLMKVLAEDSTLMSDGGGRARAALRPIQGAERIARFLLGIQKNVPSDAEFRVENFNGGKGILVVSAGIPISVITFSVTGGQIAGIYIISNPDKLRHLSELRSER